MAVSKMSDNDDILVTAEAGDMIQFHRGRYSHWAIYIGDGLVIHRWGDDDGVGKTIGWWGNLKTISGVKFDKATILQSAITDVMKLGGTARVNNYLDYKYKPLAVPIILDQARRSINTEGYNLVYSNCEHFATECRYGQPNSRQVQVAVGASVVAGFLLSLALGAGAYLISRPTANEQEESDENGKMTKKIQINM